MNKVNIAEYLTKADYANAFKLLFECIYFLQEDLQNEAALLHSRYIRVVNDNNRGLIAYDEYQIQLNRIINSCFILLNSIPDHINIDKQVKSYDSTIIGTWILYNGKMEESGIYTFENNGVLKYIFQVNETYYEEKVGKNILSKIATGIGNGIGSFLGRADCQWWTYGDILYILPVKLNNPLVDGLARVAISVSTDSGQYEVERAKIVEVNNKLFLHFGSTIFHKPNA